MVFFSTKKPHYSSSLQELKKTPKYSFKEQKLCMNLNLGKQLQHSPADEQVETSFLADLDLLLTKCPYTTEPQDILRAAPHQSYSFCLTTTCKKHVLELVFPHYQ